MAIATNKNTTYGPPNVNQKYAPLHGPIYVNADRAIYTGLLNNRMRMLRGAGLIGQQLELAMPDWATAAAAEVGNQPPLVVVSSNRAKWIRRGINAANAELLNHDIDAYIGVSDLRALTDLSDTLEVSPPLYAPSRVGPNRNVYVVVNIAEYWFYKAQLAGTGITPVGWSFATPPNVQRGGLSMLGFGATRFAAMQFCKTLRDQATAVPAAGGVAPWNSAWIIDDNTVALGNFAGFTAVETALGGNACAGFHGGTQALTQATNKGWARDEIEAGRGMAPAALPPSVPPGVIQQTALWNIDYFNTHHLNFGPLYITSAEDLSITNRFNRAPVPYQYYNGINVVKEEPVYDNSAGARKVNKGRQDLARWITYAESANPPIGTPPPPILVQPTNPADGGVQTLSQFVVNRVLPNAPAVSAQAGNADTQAQAKCQAVEQLTCGALNAGYVNPAAITATFNINGAAPQPVQRRDLP